MTTTATSFWAPKAGLSADEWEDAFCYDAEQGRFSVADGASESSFSATWARLLAYRFVAAPPDGADLGDWLRPLQKEWARGLDTGALPWYAEEKARSGAFSSLLGVRLDADRWRAMAVGDSCLFTVRENRLVASFPYSKSSEFHSRPFLLSSLARANNGVAPREVEGDARPGDLVLLMTDALAAWFLVEAEMRRRPWSLLERLRTQEDFAKFVELMRAGRSMRNDDVTLLRIEVDPKDQR